MTPDERKQLRGLADRVEKLKRLHWEDGPDLYIATIESIESELRALAAEAEGKSATVTIQHYLESLATELANLMFEPGRGYDLIREKIRMRLVRLEGDFAGTKPSYEEIKQEVFEEHKRDMGDRERDIRLDRIEAKLEKIFRHITRLTPCELTKDRHE